MNYRLIKTEPYKYSRDQFVYDGETIWDGVRNYQARNNLNAMSIGDYCLWYHSNEGKEIVGVAEVVQDAFPDPTIQDERWLAVKVKPLRQFSHPVSLATIKADPYLKDMVLLQQQRLSVAPVSEDEFMYIEQLSQRG